MPSRSREAAAQKKHRRSPLLVLLLALAVVVGGYRLYTGYFPFQPRYSLDGEVVSQETLSQLRTLAKEEPQAKYILKHLDDYPADLLSLLGRNSETLDFVSGYPQHKHDTPADTVGEVTQRPAVGLRHPGRTDQQPVGLLPGLTLFSGGRTGYNKNTPFCLELFPPGFRLYQ